MSWPTNCAKIGKRFVRAGDFLSWSVFSLELTSLTFGRVLFGCGQEPGSMNETGGQLRLLGIPDPLSPSFKSELQSLFNFKVIFLENWLKYLLWDFGLGLTILHLLSQGGNWINQPSTISRTCKRVGELFVLKNILKKSSLNCYLHTLNNLSLYRRLLNIVFNDMNKFMDSRGAVV